MENTVNVRGNVMDVNFHDILPSTNCQADRKWQRTKAGRLHVFYMLVYSYSSGIQTVSIQES